MVTRGNREEKENGRKLNCKVNRRKLKVKANGGKLRSRGKMEEN
jgi:hypothetical protein